MQEALVNSFYTCYFWSRSRVRSEWLLTEIFLWKRRNETGGSVFGA
jgi:hypothetical protein